MRGGGYAEVLPVLQVPDNKADAVPCERLQFTKPLWQYIVNELGLLPAGQWTGLFGRLGVLGKSDKRILDSKNTLSMT
jgi:hypothetical protein